MNLSHVFYNCLVNPVMRALLRSPIHAVVSGNIAILHYQGRRSGRSFNTPLSYVREADTVLLLSSLNTGWWKNFRDGAAAVEVEIGGRRHAGTAVLHEGDTDALRDGVRRFLIALPRDAIVYGVKLDKSKRPIDASIADTAPRLVVVEISLE